MGKGVRKAMSLPTGSLNPTGDAFREAQRVALGGAGQTTGVQAPERILSEAGVTSSPCDPCRAADPVRHPGLASQSA